MIIFVPCVFFIPEISITNKFIYILTRNKLFSQIISFYLILNKFIEIILYFWIYFNNIYIYLIIICFSFYFFRFLLFLFSYEKYINKLYFIYIYIYYYYYIYIYYFIYYYENVKSFIWRQNDPRNPHNLQTLCLLFIIAKFSYHKLFFIIL